MTPAPCPRCGKPLALTRTTTTEIMLVAGGHADGATHPVLTVIHCEDGHEMQLHRMTGPLAAMRILNNASVDDFTDPPTRKEHR